MFSNRCFYETVGTLKNVAYVMINTFRMNYNTAIYEGKKLQKKGTDFQCFMFHINEEEFQNKFFLEGVKNYREINEFPMYLMKSTEELSIKLREFDTIFIDQPYLKEEWEVYNIVKSINKNIVSFEHNVSVPVRIAARKEEYSARTIRPKIWNKVEEYKMRYPSLNCKFNFEEKALRDFTNFIETKLKNYINRNDPSNDYQSHMSKYLKYGFISVNEMLERLEMTDNLSSHEYLEELIVRRELAYNFVFYNKGYNDFDRMTYKWAYETMESHKYDLREYNYSVDDYMSCNTHDRYFNASMKEMIYCHTMHGYMRMYWAKKILEWSTLYEEAYKIIIKLNNSLFLDGNTPNGYMNVAWIFGKHDRAWKERKVFGKLRYMNANGLKRKFEIEKYVKKMEGFDVSKT